MNKKKTKKKQPTRHFFRLDDKPYDANYLLLVYGSRVYNNFIALARGLTSAAYQSLPNKQSDERTHILFLLLMIVLLFTDQFDFGLDMIVNDHHLPISNASNSSQTTMSRSLSTTSESRSSVSSISSGSSSSSSTRFSEKLQKIQQIYIETACRYLYDEFGLTIGRQIFHNLLPLLIGTFVLIELSCRDVATLFFSPDNKSRTTGRII